MVAQWLGFLRRRGVRRCAVCRCEFADRVVKRGGSIGFERYVLAEATANPLPLRRFAFNPEIVKIVAGRLVVRADQAALLHSRVVSLEKRADRIVSVEIETEGGRPDNRWPMLHRCERGDAVLARQAVLRVLAFPQASTGWGSSSAEVFRLSGVDIDAFGPCLEPTNARSHWRASLRATSSRDVLSVAPVGSSDAICLMSHIDNTTASIHLT